MASSFFASLVSYVGCVAWQVGVLFGRSLSSSSVTTGALRNSYKTFPWKLLNELTNYFVINGPSAMEALSLSSEFCEIDVFNKIVQLMWKREVCERRLHLQLMSKVNNFLSQNYWTKSLRLVKLQFGMECPLRITGIKVDSTEEGIQARFKFNYLVDFYRYPGWIS